MGAHKRSSQRVWKSNEEDEGTVEGHANLNKRSASDAPRWPLMAPRVARLREGVQTLKKQHVRWHVRQPRLPRGLKARPPSLFAENEFSTRDWGACDPIGHRYSMTSASENHVDHSQGNAWTRWQRGQGTIAKRGDRWSVTK